MAFYLTFKALLRKRAVVIVLFVFFFTSAYFISSLIVGAAIATYAFKYAASLANYDYEVAFNKSLPVNYVVYYLNKNGIIAAPIYSISYLLINHRNLTYYNYQFYMACIPTPHEINYIVNISSVLMSGKVTYGAYIANNLGVSIGSRVRFSINGHVLGVSVVGEILNTPFASGVIVLPLNYCMYDSLYFIKILKPNINISRVIDELGYKAFIVPSQRSYFLSSSNEELNVLYSKQTLIYYGILTIIILWLSYVMTGYSRDIIAVNVLHGGVNPWKVVGELLLIILVFTVFIYIISFIINYVFLESIYYTVPFTVIMPPSWCMDCL